MAPCWREKDDFKLAIESFIVTLISIGLIAVSLFLSGKPEHYSEEEWESYLQFVYGFGVVAGIILFVLFPIYISWKYRKYKECMFKETIKEAVKEAIRGEK